MKLIFAQGNPGSEYMKTRHNVGFQALDFYAAQHELEFREHSRFHADVAEMKIGDTKVLFAKPTTFYNETGQSAHDISYFYKIDPQDILVIHDELALPFGTIRTREKGSDAGNNGIKSLNTHLGETYARIRVGIANELSEKADASNFVLGNFTEEETKTFNKDLLPKIADLIDDFIDGRHTASSHKF